MSFATGFKRETECFEGTVDLTGGEESGGYWLGEKGEAGSGGSGGLGGSSPGVRDGGFRPEAPPESCHGFCIGN